MLLCAMCRKTRMTLSTTAVLEKTRSRPPNTCGVVVDTMTQEGMGSVLKHFPGYGNNADTHTGVAYDDRPYETFQTSDFLPFQSGINSGASMVLVSHNVVNCLIVNFPLPFPKRYIKSCGKRWLFGSRHHRRPGYGRGEGIRFRRSGGGFGRTGGK